MFTSQSTWQAKLSLLNVTAAFFPSFTYTTILAKTSQCIFFLALTSTTYTTFDSPHDYHIHLSLPLFPPSPQTLRVKHATVHFHTPYIQSESPSLSITINLVLSTRTLIPPCAHLHKFLITHTSLLGEGTTSSLHIRFQMLYLVPFRPSSRVFISRNRKRVHLT